MSSAYIGIGVFASSTTNNQIVAFLLALFIAIFFHVLFEVFASGMTGNMGGIINYLSTRAHFESMSRGVIDSRDILFFLSVSGLALYYAQINLSKRNWQS
jgi:ABC-2 type transport system permease protein